MWGRRGAPPTRALARRPSGGCLRRGLPAFPPAAHPFRDSIGSRPPVPTAAAARAEGAVSTLRRRGRPEAEAATAPRRRAGGGSVMSELQRVCCAVDLSEASRLALVESAEVARRFGAELTVVYVQQPVAPAAIDALAAPSNLAAQAAAELELALEAWCSEAEQIAGRPVRSAVLSGEPAREIVRYARDKGVDLVVLATHGRTGLRRVVLGSVAEHVVRHAPCTVLVVRRRAPTQDELTREEVAQYGA